MESCGKAVATKNHLGPNALVRAGERSSPVTKASYGGKIGELRSAGRVRAPAPTWSVVVHCRASLRRAGEGTRPYLAWTGYTHLMCVAIYHWLPNRSCT